MKYDKKITRVSKITLSDNIDNDHPYHIVSKLIEDFLGDEIILKDDNGQPYWADTESTPHGDHHTKIRDARPKEVDYINHLEVVKDILREDVKYTQEKLRKLNENYKS